MNTYASAGKTFRRRIRWAAGSMRLASKYSKTTCAVAQSSLDRDHAGYAQWLGLGSGFDLGFGLGSACRVGSGLHKTQHKKM